MRAVSGVVEAINEHHHVLSGPTSAFPLLKFFGHN